MSWQMLLAGAEPEDLITAVIAAVLGRGGIVAGDAIGANVAMFTLVLGLAAVLGPIPIGGIGHTKPSSPASDL